MAVAFNSCFLANNSDESTQISTVYFKRCAEIWCAENISARLGSAWPATVLDKENIAVLKQRY